MLVLIDESGCAGFKLSKGSSSHFVIAMVIFNSDEVAEAASRAISDLKLSLGINTEFKFSKTSSERRDKFFDKMHNFDFKVRALVVNKAIIHSPQLRTDKSSFYNYFLKQLIHHDNSALINASIKIDGSGDKIFKRKLQAYLRQELSANKIKKFRFIDSKKDNLIQLADMVVGVIARSYKPERADASRLLEKLKQENKIDNIWNFT
jgi:hypothetical protein